MNSVKNVLSYYGFMCIVGFDVILEVVRHVAVYQNEARVTVRRSKVGF